MNIQCPICGDCKVQDLVYHQGVYRCTKCQHLFRINALDFDYTFYEKHDYWYNDPHWHRFMKTYFAFFEDYISLNTPSIELGAANGDFLSSVYDFQSNFVVGGIPELYYNELKDILNPIYNSIIPKERRLIGPIETITFPCTFENVFLIEVLEHFKDPYLVETILKTITKKHGRVFIATDNALHLNAVDMMFHHLEHLHIFSYASFSTVFSNSNWNCLLHWHSPVGKKYIVLERV